MSNLRMYLSSGFGLAQLQPGKAVGIAFLLLSLVTTIVVQIRKADLNIKQVAVHGDIDQAQRKVLYEFVKENGKSFSNITDVKERLETVSWVHHVNVQQVWPDNLSIEVIREKPIAYWNDDAFINFEGKVFKSVYENGGPLAQLYGPAGSESEVMIQYQELSTALSPADQTIEILTLDARGSWQFTNQHDVRVLLGKDDIMERVHRFVLISGSSDFVASLDFVRKVDTRYSNGVAVDWKEDYEASGIAKTFGTHRDLRL
jgi:cell division protein FtsQ